MLHEWHAIWVLLCTAVVFRQYIHNEITTIDAGINGNKRESYTILWISIEIFAQNFAAFKINGWQSWSIYSHKNGKQKNKDIYIEVGWGEFHNLKDLYYWIFSTYRIDRKVRSSKDLFLLSGSYISLPKMGRKIS